MSSIELLVVLRTTIHYSLHFLFPGLLAWIFFKKYWKKAWLIMLATMLIDLDHLWASPIFDANRCSIGFHPMHSYYAIGIYIILFFVPKFRIVAIGLLLHILTDFLDCLWI